MAFPFTRVGCTSRLLLQEALRCHCTPLPRRTFSIIQSVARSSPRFLALQSAAKGAPSSEPLTTFTPGRIYKAIRTTYGHGGSNRSSLGSGSSFMGGGGGGHRPSSNSFRRRLDSLPSNYIFYGILVINGLVFLGWWSARQNMVYISYNSWYRRSLTHS